MCEGPKYGFHVVTHVLCVSELECLGDLCICHVFIF